MNQIDRFYKIFKYTLKQWKEKSFFSNDFLLNFNIFKNSNRIIVLIEAARQYYWQIHYSKHKKKLQNSPNWGDLNGNFCLIVSSRKISLKDESFEKIKIPKMTVYVRHFDE
jgi:hypothetical protein